MKKISLLSLAIRVATCRRPHCVLRKVPDPEDQNRKAWNEPWLLQDGGTRVRRVRRATLDRIMWIALGYGFLNILHNQGRTLNINVPRPSP